MYLQLFPLIKEIDFKISDFIILIFRLEGSFGNIAEISNSIECLFPSIKEKIKKIII